MIADHGSPVGHLARPGKQAGQKEITQITKQTVLTKCKSPDRISRWLLQFECAWIGNRWWNAIKSIAQQTQTLGQIGDQSSWRVERRWTHRELYNQTAFRAFIRHTRERRSDRTSLQNGRGALSAELSANTADDDHTDRERLFANIRHSERLLGRRYWKWPSDRQMFWALFAPGRGRFQERQFEGLPPSDLLAGRTQPKQSLPTSSGRRTGERSVHRVLGRRFLESNKLTSEFNDLRITERLQLLKKQTLLSKANC